MRRTRRLAVLALVPALVLAAGACRGQAPNAGKGGSAGGGPVKIMVGGIDKVIYLPAMLSQQLGYFKAEGVDVKLLTEPSGASAENVLVAGQVSGVVGFYDHTVTLQAQGKCIESVAQLAKVPGEVEMVSKKNEKTIRSTADFRGKRLGVTSLGSSTDYLTQYLATKAGLKKGEYTTVKAGAGPTFVSAMDNGGIDAGMTTDPTVAQLVSTGKGKILLDMRTEAGTRKALGGLYPASSLYMDCAYVKQNGPTVQKIVDAFVKTMHWISTHDADQIAAKMPKDYAGGDPKLYAQSIKDSKAMFTTDGRMPHGGPRTVLGVLGTFNPQVKAKRASLKLDQTYTTTFVDAAGG